jgi:hypothetical protein
MWPLDGTELQKFYLDLKNTQKLLMFGVLDAFWANLLQEELYLQGVQQ